MSKQNIELKKAEEALKKLEEIEKNKIVDIFMDKIEEYPIYKYLTDYEFAYVLRTLYEKQCQNNITFNFENIKKPRKKRKSKLKVENNIVSTESEIFDENKE